MLRVFQALYVLGLVNGITAEQQQPHTGWAITSGGGNCTIVTRGNASCIQDTSGDYGVNEACDFVYRGDSAIYRAEWGLEAGSNCNYDWLAVADTGEKYCGGEGDASTVQLPSSPMHNRTTSPARIVGSGRPVGQPCSCHEICCASAGSP